MHHFSATWKRDLGPQCGPCESFAVRILCDNDLDLNTKNSIFFVLNVDQSLAQGRLHLEPFGLAGAVSLQDIAEAVLKSYFLLAL